MITLVLGGTRSGKSAVAERLAAIAANEGALTYLATAAPAVDADFSARIAAHRGRRPQAWTTLECTHPEALGDHLRHTDGVILLDSLGTWVATHDDLVVQASDFLDALKGRDGDTIVVSEEVGLAVHPPSEAGRRYVDAVGTLNQQVAAVAERVLFVVAGHVLPLSPLQRIASPAPSTPDA